MLYSPRLIRTYSACVLLCPGDQTLPGGQRRVGLAGHQPGGAVVGVPVPLIIHRDDVHQHDVLGVLVHPGERDPDCGEHPPDRDGTGEV